MELKVNKKTVLKVDYNDLESFILDVYGVEYEIAPNEECSNGTNERYVIDKEEIREYDRNNLIHWQYGNCNPSFILRTIMIDLCNNDKIEAGEYIVNVSW